MNTEIELRTNEHHITDHIELFFLLNISCLIRVGRLVCWSVRASLVKWCVGSSSFRHPYHLTPGFLTKDCYFNITESFHLMKFIRI